MPFRPEKAEENKERQEDTIQKGKEVITLLYNLVNIHHRAIPTILEILISFSPSGNSKIILLSLLMMKLH